MSAFQVTELMVSLADCSGENTSWCQGDSNCPGGTNPCNQGTCIEPTDNCSGENTDWCPGASICAGGTNPCDQGTCIEPTDNCSGENTSWCQGDSNCPGGTNPCDQGTELPDQAARAVGGMGTIVAEPLELTELRMLLADALAPTA